MALILSRYKALGVLHSAKAKAANDFLRVQVRRPYLGIQPETVRSWDRRKSKIVEISEQAFLRDHFAPFNSILIADSACCLSSLEQCRNTRITSPFRPYT